MRSMKRKDWLVRVYDKKNKIIGKWIIENRLENEAVREALPDVQQITGYDDWTMTWTPKRKLKKVI
jgi:hypothetical protein